MYSYSLHNVIPELFSWFMNVYYVYLSVVHIFSVHKIRNLKGVLMCYAMKISRLIWNVWVNTYNIFYYKKETIKFSFFKKKNAIK